ncbi:ATP-binding protein [Pseudomonas sp. 681]|uniref:ATP-binding protein n=1 Tax=Pseudomonas fungipugnans TaxID=3024217 RepID=A0ABT6QT93_9PSED|nr:ATP-binding protein [Pseudomonas sp. 681]MDI2594131.1 ATP-binding protein [Pseudomonas sp. 681]
MLGHLYAADAIYFPRSLSASDPEALFSLCSQVTSRTGDVVLDASELVFIDPLGLATLRATLECQPDGKCVYIRYLQERMAYYLVRMDFFQGLNVEGINEDARNTSGEPFKCVELIRVADQDQSEIIASRLVQAMTGAAYDSETENPELDSCRRPIEYALKELLENSLSHAKREGGQGSSVWVACQHFEDSNSVRLAIVDNGCGFLATLKTHGSLAEPTHMNAIQAALLERVSCNRGPNIGYESDSQNQGVGLTTTARIAEAADGHLIIASGDACIHTETKGEFCLKKSPWGGVAIAFSCKRDKLPQVNIPSLLPQDDFVVDGEIRFD